MKKLVRFLPIDERIGNIYQPCSEYFAQNGPRRGKDLSANFLADITEKMIYSKSSKYHMRVLKNLLCVHIFQIQNQGDL